jgi:hypothetical protein
MQNADHSSSLKKKESTPNIKTQNLNMQNAECPVAKTRPITVVNAQIKYIISPHYSKNVDQYINVVHTPKGH